MTLRIKYTFLVEDVFNLGCLKMQSMSSFSEEEMIEFGNKLGKLYNEEQLIDEFVAISGEESLRPFLENLVSTLKDFFEAGYCGDQEAKDLALAKLENNFKNLSSVDEDVMNRALFKMMERVTQQTSNTRRRDDE